MNNAAVKILLIDDDNDDYIITRNFFKQMDEAHHYHLDWMDNFPQGYQAIIQRKYDLYLIDYRLGEKTGVELIEAAIEKGCRAPMILLTGQGDHSIDLEAMNAGATDYLVKDILTAPLLERAIRYAMEHSRRLSLMREQAALLNKTQDAIIVRDFADRIIFWNLQAEKIYGWPADEVVGKEMAKVIPCADANLLTSAEQAVLDHGDWVGELEQKTRSGQTITTESRWTLVRNDDSGSLTVLIVNTDITERKRFVEQMLRIQRMESIGALASGIAHDLNNLLQPLLIGSQVLHAKVSDANSHKVLNAMEESIRRSADLLKQVLLFSRGSGGGKIFFQIKHIIVDLTKMIKETFPRSILIETSLQDKSSFFGDATQLYQVLMNLCVNARDAMPDGGVIKITSNNIELDNQFTTRYPELSPGDYIHLTVSDTGQGIAPDLIDKIFNPFFTTKEVGQGSGLGLSTAMAIIKNHNGLITVDSDLARGTTFNIYLPVSNTERSAVQFIDKEKPPRGNGELILVVDDEASIREITKATLEAHGYQVLMASDGSECLSIFKMHQESIKLILMDQLMPTLDGPVTTRTLLELEPQLKIITATGLHPTEPLVGVRATLMKPFTVQALLHTIAETLKN